MFSLFLYVCSQFLASNYLKHIATNLGENEITEKFLSSYFNIATEPQRYLVAFKTVSAIKRDSNPSNLLDDVAIPYQ